MNSLELALIPLLGPAAIPFAITAGLLYAGGIAYSNYKNMKDCEKREFEKEGRINLEKNFDNIYNEIKSSSYDIEEGLRKSLDAERLIYMKNNLLKEYDLSSKDEMSVRVIIEKYNSESINIRQKIKTAKLEEERLKKSCVSEIKKIENNLEILNSGFEYEKGLIKIETESAVKYLTLAEREEKLIKIRIKCEGLLLKNKTQKEENKVMDNQKQKEEIIDENNDDKEILRTKIKVFFAGYEELDKHGADKIRESCVSIDNEKNIQRIKLVYENVKLLFLAAREAKSWTETYREILINLKNEIGDFDKNISDSIEEIAEKTIINKEEFIKIKEEAIEAAAKKREKKALAEERAMFAERTRDKLKNLGYILADEEIREKSEFEKLKNGEIVYFDTDDSEYKIMAKINENGELVTRAARFVDNINEKENITSYQNQKDIEFALKWCKSYDKLLESLENSGVKLDVKVRKEPTEEHVVYIAGEHKKNKKNNNILLENEKNIKE